MMLIDWLLNLFFPPKCLFCERILKQKDEICKECSLDWTFQGNHHYFHTKQGLPCYAPFWYRKLVRESIVRYKFGGRVNYAPEYAKRMVCSLHGVENVDIVTWVPLAKKRLRSRGYDQAELLAKEVALLVDRPILSTLRKVKETKAQSSIEDDGQRAKNMEGAYTLAHPVQNLENTRILLIDDVITTGSTLSSCVKVLKTAGAREVISLGIARARK